MIIQKPLIKMLLQLALNYKGTLFFRANVEYVMDNGTASCISPVYFSRCFWFGFFLKLCEYEGNVKLINALHLA